MSSNLVEASSERGSTAMTRRNVDVRHYGTFPGSRHRPQDQEPPWGAGMPQAAEHVSLPQAPGTVGVEARQPAIASTHVAEDDAATPLVATPVISGDASRADSGTKIRQRR